MPRPKISSALNLRPLKLTVMVGVAGVACAASAQVTKSGAGYLLRVKYVTGQVIKLNSLNSIVSTASKGAQPMQVKMPIVIKVNKADALTAVASVTIGPVSFADTVLREPETMDMTIDRQNRAKSKGQAGFVGGELPAQVIKVGQKWSTVAPMPDPSGAAQKMVAVYTFGGLKTVNGKSVAVMTYELGGNVKGKGTLLVLAADGTIYSNDATISVNSPTTGPVKVQSKLTRV